MQEVTCKLDENHSKGKGLYAYMCTLGGGGGQQWDLCECVGV